MERVPRTARATTVVWLLVTTLGFATAATVDVTVKETAGVAQDGYPTSVVIPLPEGDFQNTSGFRVTAGSTAVPAQFEILSRYWSRDNSIRQVLAHFESDPKASGKKVYSFQTSGSNPTPANPVQVQDNTPSGFITVTTGPLKFTINKNDFSILDTVWFDRDGNRSYADSERVILPSADHGARFDGCKSVGSGSCAADSQHDRDLAKPKYEIEEAGPMRAVVKLWLPTQYRDANDDQDTDDTGEYHRHGYAVRIYAYANKPWVKIDYQVQNSASGPDLSANQHGAWANPLYFRSLDLAWGLELPGTVTVKTGRGNGNVDSRGLAGSGVELAHTLHDKFEIRPEGSGSPFVDCGNNCYADGFLDASNGSVGVTTVIRNMWETWPNGIAIDGTGRLAVQLWPDWSRQWVRTCTNDASKVCVKNSTCSSGGTCNSIRFAQPDLYWLDDMRHVFKEVVLRFHDGSVSDSELVAFAKTIDNYPVTVVPRDWHDEAGVSLDLFGENPNSNRVGSDTLRLSYSSDDLDETKADKYKFGWDTWFIASVLRKIAPSGAGGVPDSAEEFLATESPDDYWKAEYRALAELNVRPQWMADYSYSRDWDEIGLTQAPYQGGTWRAQDFSDDFRVYGRYPINGTGRTALAMDDQHAWMYHVAKYFDYSGNPWVRDLYEFVGEFRKATLDDAEAFPDKSQRGRGHMAAGAMQAYHIAGDKTLPDFVHRWVRDKRRPDMNLECGQLERTGDLGTTAYYGFLFRPLIEAMKVHDGYDNQAWAELMSYMSAGMEWNYHYGKYGYNVNYEHGKQDCTVNVWGSSSNSSTLPDIASWYYWNTGKARFKTMNDNYVNVGLNGGKKPYGDWTPPWEGEFRARSYYWEDGQNRADSTPPAKISNVTATHAGGSLTARWTGPSGAARYLVVWADRPIVETLDPDTQRYRNWWAASPVGPSFKPTAGKNESITIPVGSTANPHVAVFTFDAAGNMSAMSNVASATSGPVETPNPPTDLTAN